MTLAPPIRTLPWDRATVTRRKHLSLDCTAEQGLLSASAWPPRDGKASGGEDKADGQREEETEYSLSSTHIASFSAGISLFNFPLSRFKLTSVSDNWAGLIQMILVILLTPGDQSTLRREKERNDVSCAFYVPGTMSE